jgi:uncharacterized protein
MAHILITGAAAGLGASLAREGTRRRHQLSLVDISPAVERVAEQLGGRSLVADLADPATPEAIYAWAPDVDVVINNAGMATRAMFTDMDPDLAFRTVMVNASAPMLLARLYLGAFRRRGGGMLVNISSSAAYFPTPGLAPYGATKAFLSSFTEALIAECAGWPGVRIVGFCPSGMATNFQQAAGVKNENPGALLDPDRVAQRVIDIIASGQSGMYDYGSSTHAFKMMRRLLPSRVYRLLLGRLMLRHR